MDNGAGTVVSMQLVLEVDAKQGAQQVRLLVSRVELRLGTRGRLDFDFTNSITREMNRSLRLEAAATATGCSIASSSSSGLGKRGAHTLSLSG